MTPATWYFDIISPYVYLQIADPRRLPPDLAITPKPVLFAGLLNHWEQKGPAEIAGKRLHTYRQCAWIAGSRGVPFRMPPAHPFNPLSALRLLCALGPTLDQARVATAFVFGQGRDPSTEEGLQALGVELGVANAADLATSDAAKAALRQNTDVAIACGVWGVPTFDVGGELFWGDDSLPMLADFLKDPTLLETGDMGRLKTLPTGATRL